MRLFLLLLFAVLAGVGQAVVDRTYYIYLGLDISATQAEIAAAYAEKKIKIESLEDEQARQAKSKLLEEAYAVLADERRRSNYDKFNRELISNPKVLANINKITKENNRKDKTIKLTLPVSVEDVYHGKVVEAQYLKMVACEKCRGTGGASPKAMRACGQCGGQGFGIQEGMDYYGKKFVGENTCHACQGWGKQATTLCPVCHGAKVAPRIEKVKIQIPNGLPDGNTLRIPNFGDEPVIGAPADLEVTIVEIPTEHWSRKNNDLYYTMEISLKEAIFGFTKSFTHLNGQSITITRKEVTNKDTMMTRPDEGILNPKTGKSGRLVIKFRIRMEQFTDRQLDMWEQFFQEHKL